MAIGDFVLMWSGPVLQLSLLIVFVRYGFRELFPVFFYYTLYSIIATILANLLIHHEVLLFWAFWAAQLISEVWALLALQEVFQSLWDFKQGVLRYLLPVLLLAIAVLAAGWGLNHPMGRGRLIGVYTAFITFTILAHFVKLVACGLALWLAKQFSRYEIGVALGFGVSAIGTLAAYMARFHFGIAIGNVFLLGAQTANMVAIGIWLVVFLSKPPKGDRPRLDAHKFQEMKEMLKQQDEMAGKISEGVGLRWPGKKKKKDGPEQKLASCVSPAGLHRYPRPSQRT